MESVDQADTSLGVDPVIDSPLPLFTRLNCAIRLWLFKALFTFTVPILRMVKAREMNKIGPTYTKRYDVRPMLENRVFIPQSYQSGTKLPLYIDIHGGGFAIGDPQLDDEFCCTFADKYGFCVVSINYRKAPLYPFPYTVHDVAEVTKAVLADKDLPVDPSTVVGGGFSAGGNLILAVCQIDGLHNKFRGIVPVYPVVDFSSKYKGEYRTTRTGKPDMLRNMGTWFNWGYINAGEDRTNPLLSPIYASRSHLPRHILFVGAEHDYLCHEAIMMAKKLVGAENDDSIGESSPWSRDGVKWYIASDVQHGYTHTRAQGEEEEHRKKVTENTYEEMARWIKEEVLVD